MVKKDKVDTNGIGYEWEYAQVEDTRSTFQKISNFIYNPENHAFLGRTAKSWGQILLFYAIFYSCLALLFAICMKIWLSPLENEQKPKWITSDSIIGTNPGLGFRPMGNHSEGASLVWYQADNETNWKAWTSNLDTFLQNYTEDSLARVDCSYNHPARPGSVCRFNVSHLAKCAPENKYGFPEGQPCVFLKLNRIYGWMPKFYDKPEDLPRIMPEELVQNITALPKEHWKTVWVSCAGESPADKQNIGALEYYPTAGFPGYYYPYEHSKGYLSPLVAVKFLSPRRNTLINVECRAWARNIIYKKNSQQREGSVHFELLVD